MVFRRIQQMFAENPKLSEKGGWVYARLLTFYGDYLVMSVRREVDRGPEGLNLKQLLEQLRRYPHILSRERYMSRIAAIPGVSDLRLEIGQKYFDTISNDGPWLSRTVVNKDLRLLKKATDPVVIYANKRVAHRTDVEVRLSIAEADKALDAIETIMQKYYALLAGPALMGLEPTPQWDWTESFTFPWIVPTETCESPESLR